MSANALALSVVIATGHRWPEAEATLRAILASDPPGGLEAILCDGDGAGAPPPGERDPRLRVVSAPGESVFALRARGVALARADVVAMTEDHCVPAPDWATETIAAHDRHPDAVAIAGAVTNGSTEGSLDWANFLMTFADHLPPMPATGVRAPSVANGSIKRAAAGIPVEPEPGWLELELMGELMAAGRIAYDDGPRVTHVQSHGGALATLAAHFHNGRACAGLGDDRPGARSLVAARHRLASMPVRLVREVRGALNARPPLAPAAAAGARLVPLVAAAHTLGTAVGLVRGPGDSPGQLD